MAKILLKSCVPLVAVAGVLTYGVYLRGGDPGVLWKRVAEGTVSKAGNLFSGIGNDASRAVGELSSQAVGAAGDTPAGQRTELYTWKDDEGVTHFASTMPSGIPASTISVDPNVNVLAPVSTRITDRRAQSSDDADHEVAIESGGRLPGVAGTLSGGQSGGMSQAGAAVDAAQLLRALQSAGH